MTLFGNRDDDQLPLVCTPDALNADERRRYDQVRGQLAAFQQGIDEFPDGYGLRFPGKAAVLRLLAEFITLERRCCPFLDFTLEVPAGGADVTLRLSGRTAGTKDFLRQEM
jgi:hypothetical protein